MTKHNKMMYNTEDDTVYLGPRGEKFINMIKALLEKANIVPKYMKLLLSKESLEEYGKAFTDSTAEAINNYEVYEQLGDLSANKFIVSYMYKRFPKLRQPQGVRVVARLRINYGAKQTFFEIARNLGFWEYVSASQKKRDHQMKALLEDSFEAFIGCTEFLLDCYFRPGVGYAIVHDILSSIFDKIDISLKYEDLYDAKTRLKELFDIKRETLGKVKYEDTFNDDGKRFSQVYAILPSGQRKRIGQGIANIKPDAQQKAASNALNNLAKLNIKKPLSDFYKELEK